MELTYGVWNFEVVPTFLENLCTHVWLDIWLVSYLASLFVCLLKTSARRLQVAATGSTPQ